MNRPPLTKHLCLNAINDSTHKNILCKAPKCSPISLALSKLKATDNLDSPKFLSEEYIRTHYNIHKYIQIDKVYGQIFKLNKHNELICQDKKILES